MAARGVTLAPAPDRSEADGETTPHGSAEANAASGEALGSYDTVIVCMPSAQAAALVRDVSPPLEAQARAVRLEPCFALGFAASTSDEDRLRALPFDGVFVGREDAPASASLAWIARDSSKPGRPPGERWVLHASPGWSRAWFDATEADVARALLDEMARLFQLGSLEPSLNCVRRWSFARAAAPLEQVVLFDEAARVGVGGDWAWRGRIEGAFLSGLELARRVLA